MCARLSIGWSWIACAISAETSQYTIMINDKKKERELKLLYAGQSVNLLRADCHCTVFNEHAHEIWPEIESSAFGSELNS